MNRIRNKNKRQENKNILLTNKKTRENETFNERNQNRSIHC